MVYRLNPLKWKVDKIEAKIEIILAILEKTKNL